MLRVGIVGAGFGLNAHLPAFGAVAGADVAAIADSGSGKARERLPAGVTYASSWRELITLDLDAISIATPPGQQHEIMIAALAQGMHVFCEKPFGATLAQAEAMADCAHRAPGSVVAVNFQFRYERGIAMLKEKLQAGLIGQLRAIDISWLTAGRAGPQSPWSWRNDAAAGGGVISAFFSHVADLFCWLSSADAISVFGQMQTLIAERTDDAGHLQTVTAEDAVTAQIEMVGGLLATCRITNCQFGGDGMRIELRGDRGVLVYRHIPPFASEDQSLELRTRDGAINIPLVAEPHSQADSRLHAVYCCVADFAARVSGDAQAQPPTFVDGLRVQYIMEALRASATTRQTIAVQGHL